MAASLLQPTFSGGELSPSLYSRVDIARYGTSLRKCRNFIVRPYGGVDNRPGTRFVGEVNDSGEVARLIPFQYSSDIMYVVVVNNGYFEFIYNGSFLESSPGVRVQVAIPYASDELFDLKFTQSADVMYLCHKNHQPRQLRRTSATSFELVEFEAKNGPFTTVNTNEAIKLVSSATTGLVTVTANADVFAATDVGSLIYLEQKDLANINPWEPGDRDVAVGEMRRSDGKTYRCSAFASNGGDNWHQTGSNKPVHDTGKAWDGPGDQRTSGTDKYTVGVQWEYLHSGYGIVKITEYVDAQTVKGIVTLRLPDNVVGGLGSPGTTWTFSGNGTTTVFSITGASSSSTSNYTVTIDGTPTQSDPYYPGGGGGGGGPIPNCVSIDMLVIERDCGVIQAGNVRVGDWLLRGDGSFGRVVFSQPRDADGVRIVADDFGHLDCSTEAPIQSRDTFRLAPDMLGHETPRWRMDDGELSEFGDALVMDIRGLGTITVQHITLDAPDGDEYSHVFLASGDGIRWWAHHNAKDPPSV